MSEDTVGSTARRATEQGIDELLATLFSRICHNNGRDSEEAFAEMYDMTSARLYGLVLSVVRAPDMAAEITQEVYVEMWRQAARFSPAKGSVRAWMHTIALRRVQ